MSRLTDIRRMRKGGVLIPRTVYRACRDSGLPVAVGASVVMQETAGGQNVWHNDDTWMIGYPVVSEEVYRVYEAHRERFGRQGIGPCGLTWHTFQDDAEKFGGAWDPYANCRVAFDLLVGYRFTAGSWLKAFARYNGRPGYADQMEKRRLEWEQVLA